jgi:hypothetical protein
MFCVGRLWETDGKTRPRLSTGRNAVMDLILFSILLRARERQSMRSINFWAPYYLSHGL